MILGSYILSWLLFGPLAGAFWLLLSPKSSPHLPRKIASLICLLFFIFSIYLALTLQFSEFRSFFEEKSLWIPALGISYILKADILSLLLTALSSFLSFIACVILPQAQAQSKQTLFLLLLMLTGIHGVFLANDLFLFFFFWELALIPMFFLIGRWGGARRGSAALKFFIFTQAGSLALLFAILILYIASPQKVFDWDILSKLQLSVAFQKIVFCCLFIAFGVKLPIFGLHTWLPDAHTEAPTAGSVLLAGVLLKMGAYGFFRFLIPLCPDAWAWAQPFIFWLACTGMIYGAFAAYGQSDLKRMIAYSSISHMSMILLGFVSFNATGWTGALFQMISHALTTGALFIVISHISYLTGHRIIHNVRGLANQAPVLAGFLIFFSMASLGLPFLSGFVGEFMILLGAFTKCSWTMAAASITLIMTAGYFTQTIKYTVFTAPEKQNLYHDISRFDSFVLGTLAFFSVLLGSLPFLISNPLQQWAVQILHSLPGSSI